MQKNNHRMVFVNNNTTLKKLLFSISSIFYLISLLLAVGCYYFSISDGLFYWFFPDELAASNSYNIYGILGCAKSYYLHTTINRITATMGVCWMAQTASLFSTPFLGWVFARLIFYVFIPISITYVLKAICHIPLKFSLIIALILSAMALFLVSFDVYYMFGLDLAIYATATISFFVLVALFPSALKYPHYFVLFCIIFAINLNSHELFLIISCFFIPLFAWYSRSIIGPVYKDKSSWLILFLKDSFKNPRLWILLIIYILSTLATMLAPGVKMRQSIWPSSGTFFDGLSYMALSIEEMIYLLYKAHWFLILISFLGILAGLLIRKKEEYRYTLLFGFLFFSPLLYLIVTGFLIGITPSLQLGSLRTASFQWIETMFQNTTLIKQGGSLAIRQNLFLYLGLFLDCFILFFLIGAKIQRSFNIQFNIWPLKIALFFITIIIFLLHPDGTGSTKVLPILFEKNAPSNFDSLQQKGEIQPKSLLNQYFPLLPRIDTFRNSIFPKKNRVTNHELSIINLRASNYLHANAGKIVPGDILSPVYAPMIDGYKILRDDWIKPIYTLYKIPASSQTHSCTSFSDKIKSEITCHKAFGEKNLSDILRDRKILPLSTINLNLQANVEQKNSLESCPQWSDTLIMGEHFLATEMLLKKGLHYFIFKTKPSNTQLYVYLIGEKTSVLIPWLNLPDNGTGWSYTSADQESLVPIFSQKKTTPTSETIKIVIYSSINQKINLRWQHAYAGNTAYDGKKENISSVCRIQHGRIIVKK